MVLLRVLDLRLWYSRQEQGVSVLITLLFCFLCIIYIVLIEK